MRPELARVTTPHCAHAMSQPSRSFTTHKKEALDPPLAASDMIENRVSLGEGKLGQSTSTPSGGISASVLIVVLVGLASGALFGLLLGQVIAAPALIAVIASFLAVATASAVRHFVVSVGAGAWPPGGGMTAIPSVVLVNSAIASVFGGLAAHGLLTASGPPVAPLVTGAAAGLFGGILMALLMISYYSAREEGLLMKRKVAASR
jgi:hypothetical protein